MYLASGLCRYLSAVTDEQRDHSSEFHHEIAKPTLTASPVQRLSYSIHRKLITTLQGLLTGMKNIDSHHETESSQTNKHNSSQIADVSRRRFLTTSGKIGLTTAVSIAGIGQAAGADTEEHDLFIQGLGERADYSFVVSGNLEKDSYSGADIDDTDVITNNGASGTVENGGDAYTFTGDLLAFDLNGEAQVSLGAHGARVGNRPDYLLTIEGFGTHTPYSFSVEENLQKSAAGNATISDSDTIVEQSAHGAVGSGTDAYTFDGSLHAFDFNQSGEVNVLINGRPAQVGQRPDHVLSVEGFGTETSYSFVVPTGNDIAKSRAYGATINAGDEIEDSSARGAVANGTDSWKFSGSLRAFDFDRSGEINVLLDGKPARVGQRPDHTFDVVATGGYTTYELSVTGSVYADRDVEEGQDTISGSSISGAVSVDGADYYGFDGEITSLEADGGAALVRDGQRIDESDY